MPDLSRRGFLRGLLASAAALPITPTLIDQPRFEAYTSHFRWEVRPILAKDWRYVTRIVNIDTQRPLDC